MSHRNPHRAPVYHTAAWACHLPEAVPPQIAMMDDACSCADGCCAIMAVLQWPAAADVLSQLGLDLGVTAGRWMQDIKHYLQWLQQDVGFDGWRFDFAKGYSGRFVREYIEATSPSLSIGEVWTDCDWNGSELATIQVRQPTDAAWDVDIGLLCKDQLRKFDRLHTQWHGLLSVFTASSTCSLIGGILPSLMVILQHSNPRDEHGD